ncbi:hypothetical protein B0H15DRAFT_809121 [Mycena belliarum]|uniref:Uncharacterized protein n=1 Tax=Mycena belliarum TaxID=1033014 RepID=A0AAD6Y2A0_9AGAR|nr:hypothetical protein B0H15DRAFT_809121 [Mycena belliae]
MDSSACFCAKRVPAAFGLTRGRRSRWKTHRCRHEAIGYKTKSESRYNEGWSQVLEGGYAGYGVQFQLLVLLPGSDIYLDCYIWVWVRGVQVLHIRASGSSMMMSVNGRDASLTPLSSAKPRRSLQQRSRRVQRPYGQLFVYMYDRGCVNLPPGVPCCSANLTSPAVSLCQKLNEFTAVCEPEGVAAFKRLRNQT